MKILYLTTVLPSQRKTGGEIASQCFIDALKQGGHKVLVLGYRRQGDVVLNPVADEMPVGYRYIETYKSKFYPLLWMGLSLITKLPYSSAKYYSQNYIRKVTTLLNSYNYNIIILDHAQMGWLLPLINNKLPFIFIAHNIERDIYQEQFTTTSSKVWKQIYKREAKLIQATEESLAKNAREVWTFTDHDASYFSTINKATRVFHLPSSVVNLENPIVSKTCDISIIGSWTWKANMLGLKWFFQAVYPHLPTDLSIYVAGKGGEWLEGQYSNVKYCGFVPDAQEFMAQARVIAIPSISGGGIQIKTLDAIASGTSIVATPTAMRGISEYPSSSIKVTENPKDFAHNLVELLKGKVGQIFDKENSQEFLSLNLAWSYNRREKFFADVAHALILNS